MREETIYETAAETAKKIRKALREAFPEYPARHFSVKSETYSGGSSVRVHWENYPMESDVSEITDKFKSATFDGMQDLKEYTGYEYEGKRYSGADYVLTSRDVTDERREAAWDYTERIYGDVDRNDSNYIYLYRKVEASMDGDGNYIGEYRERLEDTSAEGTGTVEEEEAVTSYLEKQLRTLKTYGIEGTEFWSDSRLEHVAEKVESIPDIERKVLQQSGDTGQSIEEVINRLVEKNIYEDLANTEMQFKDHVGVHEALGMSAELQKTLITELLEGRNSVDYKKLFATEYGQEGAFAKEFVAQKLKEVSKVESNKPELLQKVYENLETKGFKVDKNRVEEAVKEATLQRLSDTPKAGQDVSEQENYVLGICENNIVSVVLMDADKKMVNDQLKKAVQELAKNGRKVKLKQVKQELSMVRLAEMKKEDYLTGKYSEKVLEYMTALCEENSEFMEPEELTSAPTPVPSPELKTADVTVNGVDIRKVIDELRKGIVTLTFLKVDGTLRTMVATRSEQLVNGLADLNINTEDEINKQIGKGTIPVYDMQKQDMRAFNVIRLKSYTVNGETVDVEEKKEEVPVDESKHFDPTTLSTEDILNVLRTTVVRLVFRKKDGTERVMWGTRDTNLIELYTPVANPMLKKKGEDLTTLDSEEKRQAQIEKDYVKIFDLTVNEFRTFKPSQLLRMDTAHNVASWMEFKPKQDGWYNCVYAGESVAAYYLEGKRKAKDSPERENTKRIQYEREQQRLLDEANFTREQLKRQQETATQQPEPVTESAQQQEVAVQERSVSDRKERWEEARKKVFEALGKVDGYTEQDEETYVKMCEYVENLRSKFIDLQFEGKGRGEIKAVKRADKQKLLTFGYEKDMYILHPRFIMNGVSHKVFADRTGVLSFEGKARRSEGDMELDKELRTLAVLVTGRRMKNKLDFASAEGDVRRLNRFMELAKQYGKEFRDKGIVVKPNKVAGTGEPSILISVNGKRFLSAPSILYNVDSEEVLYKRERHTSTLSEFRDAIISHEQLGISQDAYRLLVGTLIESYDLRKRVRDERGEAV